MLEGSTRPTRRSRRRCVRGLAHDRCRRRGAGRWRAVEESLHGGGGDVAEQYFARLVPGIGDERRRRLIAFAEARRAHPDRIRRCAWSDAASHRGAGARCTRLVAMSAVPPSARAPRSAASAPRHLQAMSSQTCTTRLGQRGRREQRVERRDAPRVGRGHIQAIADVAQAAFADPADPRLQRPGARAAAGGAGRASRGRPPWRDVRIARIAARAAVPGRSRRSEQRVDRRPLVARRLGFDRANVHSVPGASPAGPPCTLVARTAAARVARSLTPLAGIAFGYPRPRHAPRRP